VTRIVYISLFLTTLFTGCQTNYVVSEKKLGFIEVKNETKDEKINKMIQPYRDSLTDEMETVIGISEIEMKTGQPESILGNFVCGLVMQYELEQEKQRDREGEYHPIVLMNYRGLRSSLPKGEIKVKNIFEIMPFENALVHVNLKGTVILEMAKFLVGYGGQPLSSNCKLIVDSNKTFSFTIDGNTIDTNATYTVITTDYLSNGGDNMNFFNKAISKNEINYKLRDLLIDQIKYNTKEGIKNTSTLDGRITFK
jgi:2',3'-cyclic-nucleotide 2'-phosphodiesterase (5'-nucleotidase family)